MAKRDYYEVLGVSKSATAEEIKKAHRKLVRQHHPDVQSNKGNKQSEEKFKEAQEAYDVLSDPEKRKAFDQFGHAGVGAQGAAGQNGDPFESFRRSAGARSGRPSGWRGPGNGVGVEDVEPGDFQNSGDFSDIFEQLFGGRAGAGPRRPGPSTRGRGGAAPEPAPRGADVEHPVTLTFEQAARGVTLPLQISRDNKLETIDVKIPAGVKDGSKIRIKGRGHRSEGEAGDLFIITTVRPHEYFRREGLDILLDLPVSLYEALNGTKVEVPTLEGPITLTVPPGTSSGAKLRIKLRGVLRGDDRGDQYCMVKVIVPKELDEEDRAAVLRMQAKHPINARADVKW